MARMHSRKKGASRSRPPTVEKAPDWSDVSKEELEKLIIKLHDSGLPSTKIGLTLRDQYGVPSVKLVLGKNMNRFLKEKATLPEIPEDLGNLMRRALHRPAECDGIPDMGILWHGIDGYPDCPGCRSRQYKHRCYEKREPHPMHTGTLSAFLKKGCQSAIRI